MTAALVAYECGHSLITCVDALNANTRFNSLDLAYLREQAIYNDN